jgi:hypothetical protein
VATPAETLTLMLGGDQEPTLGTDVIDDLVTDATIRDSFGRWTTDADYVPTYDLNRAAEKGWRMKAGRVAAAYNFVIEGRQVDRGEMIKNFLTMATEYGKRKMVRSARLSDDSDREALWLAPWMDDDGGGA